MLFIMIKKSLEIKPLSLCESTFIYTAYADDASFIHKDVSSAKALFTTIGIFSVSQI